MKSKFKHIAIFLQAMMILFAAVGYVHFDNCCSTEVEEIAACCAETTENDKDCGENNTKKDNCCVIDAEFEKVKTEIGSQPQKKTSKIAFLDDVWLLPIKLYIYIQLFFDHPTESNQTLYDPPPNVHKAGRDKLIAHQVFRI